MEGNAWSLKQLTAQTEPAQVTALKLEISLN
jgi:hypothetical protein